MEFIASPVLADMNSVDLSQRYRNTYVWYDGAWMNCVGFDTVRGNMIIHVSRIYDGDGIAKPLVFDWKKLNTARPPSKYYMVGDHPMLLSYPIRRQWSRGLSGTNTRVYSPSTGGGKRVGNMLKEIAEQWSKNARELFTEQKSQVLRNNIAAVFYPDMPGYAEILLRERTIAAINLIDSKYRVNPVFDQEVTEVWPGRKRFKQVPYTEGDVLGAGLYPDQKVEGLKIKKAKLEQQAARMIADIEARQQPLRPQGRILGGRVEGPHPNPFEIDLGRWEAPPPLVLDEWEDMHNEGQDARREEEDPDR